MWSRMWYRMWSRMWYRKFTTLYFDQQREVELKLKRSTKYETVAKTQGKYLAKKGVMAMCNNILICLYRKSVQLRYLADLQGWPTSQVLLPCPKDERLRRADTWSTSLELVSWATLTCRFFYMVITYRDIGKNNSRLEVITAIMITKVSPSVMLRRLVNICRSF